MQIIKLILPSFVFILFCTESFSQKITIEKMGIKRLMFGVYNYLQITSDACPCDSLIVEAKEKMEYDGDCLWKVKPQSFYPHPGMNLTVSRVQNTDTLLIDKHVFKIQKQNPLFVSSPHHNMSVKEIRNLKHIFTLAAYGEYGCYDSKAESFKVVILRDGKLIHFVNNETSTFSKALKKALKDIVPKDEIHFFDIENNDHDSLYFLNPVDFKVVVN